MSEIRKLLDTIHANHAKVVDLMAEREAINDKIELLQSDTNTNILKLRAILQASGIHQRDAIRVGDKLYYVDARYDLTEITPKEVIE